MSIIATDPIADMLTRIRNAINVRKAEASMPHSKIKEAVAALLKENNFVDGLEVVETELGKNLVVKINTPGSNARINEIVRLSTPGRRLYAGADHIPTIKQGRGIVILSTSKGLMTGKQARTERLGGELICRVY